MKLLPLLLAGLLLLGACSLTDDPEVLPASGLFVVGGGMLSNPLSDNHCIGLVTHGTTNLLYFSGMHNGIQGIRVSRQVEDTAYAPPALVPGTLGLSNFTAFSDGGRDWLVVQTPTNLVLIQVGEGAHALADPDSIPLTGIPLCLVGTNANFPGIATDGRTVLLIYSPDGTNLRAASLARDSLEQGSTGPLSATRIDTLTPSPSPVAPGGSHLRASTLGMDRDSILMARKIPNRGHEIILSDLAGHERILAGFSSPLDDCSPVYSVRERSLYMTSRAFAPDNVMRRLNIFRWKSRALDEQSAYESGPSSRTWVLTIGGPAREDIIGLVPLPERTIIAGRTSAGGSDDIFLAALDPFGGIIWQKTIGTADMEQPASLLALGGGFALVGTRTSLASSSGFILRFTADGSVTGIYQATSASGPLEFTAATTNSAGELLIAGTLRPAGLLSKAVLVRWSENQPDFFDGVSLGGQISAWQGLALAEKSGQTVIGGMSGTSPALIQVDSVASAGLYTAGGTGRVRVVRSSSTGWIFAGVSGTAGIFGGFTTVPSASRLASAAPVSDCTADGTLLAFERSDASIATLTPELDLAAPARLWGLSGGLEQRPRLFPAPDGSLYLTAQAQSVGANDMFIVKLDPGMTLRSVKPGVHDFGSEWTPESTTGPLFASDTGEASTPAEFGITGAAVSWNVQSAVSLAVHYWYR